MVCVRCDEKTLMISVFSSHRTQEELLSRNRRRFSGKISTFPVTYGKNKKPQKSSVTD